MQKNYVVKKAVHLSGGYDEKGKSVEGFLTRPGDVLVFDASNQNNLTIYRSEQIAKVLPRQSSISIEALCKGGFFEEIKPTPATKPVVVTPPPPPPIIIETPPPAPVVEAPVPPHPKKVIEIVKPKQPVKPKLKVSGTEPQAVDLVEKKDDLASLVLDETEDTEI